MLQTCTGPQHGPICVHAPLTEDYAMAGRGRGDVPQMASDVCLQQLLFLRNQEADCVNRNYM